MELDFNSNWPESTANCRLDTATQFRRGRRDLKFCDAACMPLRQCQWRVGHFAGGIGELGTSTWLPPIQHALDGRRLSFADDTPQEEPQERPRRARRPPSCGAGGHLEHGGHEH
ncbi:hypothetical protein PIB30_045049 [Stylosanthes scabra]|uniref:Uncharacterized protein n=1 Tax=Stylosanthes scabra TaxID=79078 RepID=A0ABU6THZ9_9FABA|nr:hypothetical protein [Stylosanthes scabra]